MLLKYSFLLVSILLKINCDQEYTFDSSYNNGFNTEDIDDFVLENSKGSRIRAFLSFSRYIHQISLVDNEINTFDPASTGTIQYTGYFQNVYGKELYQNEFNGPLVDVQNELELLYEFEKNRWNFISKTPANTLNYTEFYMFIYPNEFDDVNLNDAAFVFKLYDLNSDGLWSFGEYKKSIDLYNGYLLINDFKYIVDKAKNEFLKRVDIDGNKYIDLNEFAKWNMPTLKQIINDTVNEIFVKCDLNRDGVLDESEVEHNVQLFEAYEFTMYGDDFRKSHLQHNEL